jgi:hypothetical protein
LYDLGGGHDVDDDDDDDVAALPPRSGTAIDERDPGMRNGRPPGKNFDESVTASRLFL